MEVAFDEFMVRIPETEPKTKILYRILYRNELRCVRALSINMDVCHQAHQAKN